MSTVVFKLRVINPRSRDAPARNRAHMEYIGKRPGVVLNKNMSHGLFGELDGCKAEENRNLHSMTQYIRDKTKQGTIAYRAVISLTEADALRLGYAGAGGADMAKWKELVQSQFPDICGKIGIPIQNLEYTAAVHRDKGHPHVHIMFWDKAQDIKKKPFVAPAVSNKIRLTLVKHVFAEELAQWQEIKNTARSAATTTSGGFFSDFVSEYADMTKEDYAAAVERLKCSDELADDAMIYSRFKSSDMNALAADVFRLCDSVPKTGRLTYKLMPPDVKAEIAAIMDKLLSVNADCKREYDRFIEANTALAKYYSDNPDAHDHATQTARDDITVRLGNVILQSVKDIRKLERNLDRADRAAARRASQAEWAAHREAMRREMMESLVISLFSTLAQAARAAEQRHTQTARTGELSKQARKELAIKLANSSGVDWER